MPTSKSVTNFKSPQVRLRSLANSPAFTLTTEKPREISADVLLVNMAPAKGKGVELVAHGFTPAQVKRIQLDIAALGGTGKSGEVITLSGVVGVKAPILVAVGLGDFRKQFDLEDFRRSLGNGIRSLTGKNKVAISSSHAPEHIYATVMAVGLAAYSFNGYRTKSTGASKNLPSKFILSLPIPITAEYRTAVKDAATLVNAIYLARDLINTPPNDLPPAELAERAKSALSGLPVVVKIWDEKALRADGCGGILGVGLGSSRPPRLVKMTYAPKGATAHLSLVGKGITFDTGGISIKPAAKMHEMKADMSGAASVVGAMQAIATLGLKVKVTGWIAVAENMPSGTAQRPGDVLTTFDGTTVEVLNTDAEGRLVLADALGMSVAEQPDLIIDVATLTGAQRIALGRRIAGVMSNQDASREQVVATATSVGEEAWPMPLPTDLRETLNSDTADIANIGDGMGGMLSAGVFLREFIPDSQPWVHIDVAGPAYNDATAYGYTPKGGTGAMVRTFVQIASDLADS